jgi:serine/threonine-protein kinase
VTTGAPDPSEALQRERLQQELGLLLGRGGFAEVHAARDVRLKRDVAVKTLRYDLHATPLLLTRFRREAETMAKLRHPNILPIYTVGESEGLAFFIMPLVTGMTLKEALSSGRHDPPRHQAGQRDPRGAGAPRVGHGLRDRQGHGDRRG